ncbi:MAG: PAS domain-containing protein [Gammaproteobacteria bacterium]|jgi:PAS domain-containing protein
MTEHSEPNARLTSNMAADLSYALLDELPSFVWCIDAKSNITYVNKTLLEFTGQIFQDAVGGLAVV